MRVEHIFLTWDQKRRVLPRCPEVKYGKPIACPEKRQVVNLHIYYITPEWLEPTRTSDDWVSVTKCQVDFLSRVSYVANQSAVKLL